MKLRIAAAAIAALALSVTIAFAVTHTTAGSHVGTRATKTVERLGTALVNFYGDMPPGVPLGP